MKIMKINYQVQSSILLLIISILLLIELQANKENTNSVFLFFAILMCGYATILSARIMAKHLIERRSKCNENAKLIILPEKVVTEICDEIPTKVEWQFLTFVNAPYRMDGNKKVYSYFCPDMKKL